MDIEIKTIPHEQQRYPTVGDWFYDGDKLVINVSDLGSWRKNLLVAIHELVEASLCASRGITQEQVDKFDESFDGDGEPGDSPDAPYRREHFFATNIERLLCAELGIDWAEYDQQVEEL